MLLAVRVASHLKTLVVLFSRPKAVISCKVRWATMMSLCAHTKVGRQPWLS